MDTPEGRTRKSDFGPSPSEFRPPRAGTKPQLLGETPLSTPLTLLPDPKLGESEQQAAHPELKRKYALDNLQALQLPVERARQLGVSFDQVICTAAVRRLEGTNPAQRGVGPSSHSMDVSDLYPSQRI